MKTLVIVKVLENNFSTEITKIFYCMSKTCIINNYL